MTAEELRFVEEVAVTAEGMGVPATAGRILGVLLICDPPHRTAGDLVEVLGASTGAISQNLRLLEDWGMIEQVPVPGARSRHFGMRSGAWITLMRDRFRRVKQFRDLAKKGLQMVGPESDRSDRLEEMFRYYQFMFAEFPQLLERFLRGDDGEGWAGVTDGAAGVSVGEE